MKKETGVQKTQIIAELSRSAHGKLAEYVPMGQIAAKQEPEFLAHLIAWNRKKGQIRDSKVALPVVSLATREFPQEFVENSLAHLSLLDPRNLVRALRFAKEIKLPGRAKLLDRVIGNYLKTLESNWARWERTAVQHRKKLKELYALTHAKPSAMADLILFKGDKPKGTVFEAIANLKNMSVQEAASEIMDRKIPFLVATGALGEKRKDPDLVLALINRMTPTELVTNTKLLERLGVKSNAALRAAYESALEKASKSKKVTFKTTRAAEAIGDEVLSKKLDSLQERQIKTLGGIEGNWLVLGDKSGSMSVAIEASRMIASTLAKLVQGEVHLVFFDVYPRYIEVTGKTYSELSASTKHVRACGGTSIGCGLQYAIDNGLEINGIAVISDGGENNPPYFYNVYKKYAENTGVEPTVYLYRLSGDSEDVFSETLVRAGIDCQKFDLSGSNVDYYSLPNLIKTMRTSRYSLIDEIMETPLLELKDVFAQKKEEVEHAGIG